MGKHYKTKSKGDIVLSILRMIFFITAGISIINIAKWYIDSKQNDIIEEKVSKVILVENVANDDNENNNEAETSYKIDFAKLKELNSQTVAWLKVNGTDIEYAVVQSNDNSYYLKHNFEKKYNNAGWIFADYKNKLDGTDKNIVIYGHNRKNNSMFGTLKNVLKENWYNNEENHIIDFITENEEQKYEVFSVYQIKNEEYYKDTEFKDNEFGKFVATLKDRSIKDFNVEVSAEDSILTLSTCGNNKDYRIVLHAKKI